MLFPFLLLDEVVELLVRKLTCTHGLINPVTGLDRTITCSTGFLHL